MAPKTLQFLLTPLMAASTIGLGLSVAAHLYACADGCINNKAVFYTLYLGIFPLALAAAIFATSADEGTSARTIWRNTWEECPRWMRIMTCGFAIYTVVNIAIVVIIVERRPQVTAAIALDVPTPIAWHAYSGHWMAIYSGCLAVFLAAFRRLQR
jgi:hypothetical protein